MTSSPDADDWFALSSSPLELVAVSEWVVRPSCGAVVVFTGTARDHADDRVGVTHLDYEAYDEQVLSRMAAIAADARDRWPTLGRVAAQHRVGEVAVGEAAVVVAVSAPHRGEAFDAARFLIDSLKATLPIWKRERWPGGEAWVAPGAADLAGPGGLAAEPAPRAGSHHG